MHPNSDELRQFVAGRLPVDISGQVAKHINMCEFCREFCDNYMQLIEPINDAMEIQPSATLDVIIDIATQASRHSATIELHPLPIEIESGKGLPRMAADGTQPDINEPDRIITLCSINPEVVMRVVASTDKHNRYLQLLSDEPELTSYVMVQIPELDKAFMTDSDGRAEIGPDLNDDLESLKWQIKLPDAIFELEPLTYDPDRIEQAQEVILESDNDDRITVRFETRTEGKSVMIGIKQIAGQPDFGPIKVALSHRKNTSVRLATSGQLVEFDDVDSDSTISVRLYTD